MCRRLLGNVGLFKARFWWKQFGRPSGIFIDANDTIYVADHQSDAKLNPGFKRGIRIGSAKDGSVKVLIPGLGAESENQSVGEGVAADAMPWYGAVGMSNRPTAQ